MASMPTALPSPDDVSKASSIGIYDNNGKEVSFGSLIKEQKTIIVFIRHFWCGQYVMQLASVRQEALENANTRIVVIGCGDWKLINNYCDLTDFKGDMYADPSRRLYQIFGLISNLDRTPAGQEKRSYLSTRGLRNALSSIWEGPLKNPQFLGRQGNISQLGGDFIFGPGELCSYASRMKHTEDHVEVEELLKEAGVAYP